MQQSPDSTAKLKLQRIRASTEKQRRFRQTRLYRYVPYPKQAEFHAAGAIFRERLFLAGNRCGKTECGAAEMAFHLTGLYPPWWSGKRFGRAVRCWAAGVTNESTRDVVQAKLIGPPDRKEDWGTGMIPGALMIGEPAMARGVANLIDTVSVKHASGDTSMLQFKSYERGREKFQGTALEVVWLDEESPLDIYIECLTRTNETGGVVYTTFTPIKGGSEMVSLFLGDS
jgi:phage terminase large subunit-like protein